MWDYIKVYMHTKASTPPFILYDAITIAILLAYSTASTGACLLKTPVRTYYNDNECIYK